METGAINIHSLIHDLSCLHAASITHFPMGSINPVFSARGINSSGEINPFPGVRQRIKASTPIILSSSIDTLGWCEVQIHHFQAHDIDRAPSQGFPLLPYLILQ